MDTLMYERGETQRCRCGIADKNDSDHDEAACDLVNAQAARPDDARKLVDLLIEEIGACPSTRIAVRVLRGEQVRKAWRGWWAEATAIPLSALPSGARWPWLLWPPYVDEPHAILRWRLYRPGRAGYLTLTWDRQSRQVRQEPRGIDSSLRAEERRALVDELLKLASGGPGRRRGSGRLSKVEFLDLLADTLKKLRRDRWQPSKRALADAMGMNSTTLDSYLNEHGPDFAEIKFGSWPRRSE